MQLTLGMAAVAVVAGGALAGAATPPQLTAVPTVSGVALAGQTLRASPGSWSGTRPRTFAFQWQRCASGGGSCGPIQGATEQTYLLGPADVGAALEVRVTAANTVGSAAASSSPTAPVTASPAAGAVALAGGGLSLPIGFVAPPDRLALNVAAARSGSAGVLVRVQVVDAAGYPVSGAAVSLTTLPFGLYRQPGAVATSAQGLASFTLRPVPHAWLSPSLAPAVVAHADAPGATAPTPIAASDLARLGASGSAVASPYPTGARGYDLSYPNCDSQPGGDPAFAILGVNGGRPFTFNPCLTRQASWFVSGPQAVYLNTGYRPGYRGLITPACALAAGSVQTAAGLGYAVGCSEAAASLERTMLLGLSPAVWWLDVEPSNVWSSRPALNAAVLHGMLDFLAKLTPAPAVGIYSRPTWWQQITGGWSTDVPEWIPSPSGACPAPFSGGPVWLAQGGSATLDLDTGC